jgi:hypothetical protein
MHDWDEITYLRHGTERQQDAYFALIELDIFSVLADYDPKLTGTIPIRLDMPHSDLDIVCCVYDFEPFERLLRAHYDYLDEFSIRHTEKNNLPVLICRFRYRDFPVEIFGQPCPTSEQNAFKHMVAEARLLLHGGTEAEEALRALRAEGVKTEPAFSQYFKLPGDPYDSLLALADAPVDQIIEVIQRANWLRSRGKEADGSESFVTESTDAESTVVDSAAGESTTGEFAAGDSL